MAMTSHLLFELTNFVIRLSWLRLGDIYSWLLMCSTASMKFSLVSV